MLIKTPPKSNAQRQREFRERNPGYYGRLRRKRNAQMKDYAAMQAFAAAFAAIKPMPLMLPAPAEPMVFTWMIQQPERELVKVR